MGWFRLAVAFGRSTRWFIHSAKVIFPAAPQSISSIAAGAEFLADPARHLRGSHTRGKTWEWEWGEVFAIDMLGDVVVFHPVNDWS